MQGDLRRAKYLNLNQSVTRYRVEIISFCDVMVVDGTDCTGATEDGIQSQLSGIGRCTGGHAAIEHTFRPSGVDRVQVGLK